MNQSQRNETTVLASTVMTFVLNRIYFVDDTISMSSFNSWQICLLSSYKCSLCFVLRLILFEFTLLQVSTVLAVTVYYCTHIICSNLLIIVCHIRTYRRTYRHTGVRKEYERSTKGVRKEYERSTYIRIGVGPTVLYSEMT